MGPWGLNCDPAPGDQSKLNGKHVVLGRVVQGMEATGKLDLGFGVYGLTLSELCYTRWRQGRSSELQPSSKLVNGTTQTLNHEELKRTD